MSLVYITHHDENIFNIEKDPDESTDIEMFQRKLKPDIEYPKLYPKAEVQRNKYMRDLRRTQNKKLHINRLENGECLLTNSNKYQHQTMGCAKTTLNEPHEFLRKNDGIKWRRENDHVCPKVRELPPVPRAVTAHERKGASHVNFIQRNIESMRAANVKRPPPRYVDTPVGARHDLINSGLIPQFICGKNYGKVPAYLTEHKKVLKELHERCTVNDVKREDVCKDLALSKTLGLPLDKMKGLRIMEQKERNEILEGLRHHLVRLTNSYQSMSLHMDTISKKMRKTKMEAALRQIEQDILLMERCPTIYVTDV